MGLSPYLRLFLFFKSSGLYFEIPLSISDLVAIVCVSNNKLRVMGRSVISNQNLTDIIISNTSMWMLMYHLC